MIECVATAPRMMKRPRKFITVLDCEVLKVEAGFI